MSSDTPWRYLMHEYACEGTLNEPIMQIPNTPIIGPSKIPRIPLRVRWRPMLLAGSPIIARGTGMPVLFPDIEYRWSGIGRVRRIPVYDWFEKARRYPSKPVAAISDNLTYIE